MNLLKIIYNKHFYYREIITDNLIVNKDESKEEKKIFFFKRSVEVIE